MTPSRQSVEPGSLTQWGELGETSYYAGPTFNNLGSSQARTVSRLRHFYFYYIDLPWQKARLRLAERDTPSICHCSGTIRDPSPPCGVLGRQCSGKAPEHGTETPRAAQSRTGGTERAILVVGDEQQKEHNEEVRKKE